MGRSYRHYSCEAKNHSEVMNSREVVNPCTQAHRVVSRRGTVVPRLLAALMTRVFGQNFLRPRQE